MCAGRDGPCLGTHSDCAMTRIIDFAAPLGQKAGSNHWNDLDMLEVGNGGMTYDGYGACTCLSQPISKLKRLLQ